MEQQSVSTIRENTRKLLSQNRRLQRDEVSNFRRSIPSARTAEDISMIIEKLKTKSFIDAKELKLLKNTLMTDPNVIEKVLNTHGALRGIVREFTGQDVSKQLEAVDCLCNLGLGDVRACTAVARAAGPYLVTQMASLSSNLAISCAYTVGTVAAADRRVSELVSRQGALTPLTSLLSADREARGAALYAVTMIVYRLGDGLSSKHQTQILQAINKLEIDTTVQLLFALSCLNPDNTTECFQRLLSDLDVSILEHLTNCKGNTICCKLVYTLRILANVTISDANFVAFMLSLKSSRDKFSLLLNCGNEYVKQSFVWLVGNLYNYTVNNNNVSIDFFDVLL